jgi:hypothetical protein
MYSKREFTVAMREADIQGRFIRRNRSDRGLYVGMRS